MHTPLYIYTPMDIYTIVFNIEAETKWPPLPIRRFQMLFLERKCMISIKISFKFVPKGPFNNIPALVQIIAWRRPGDMPLSETIMVSLLTQICVTRPQWVKIQFMHFANAEIE